MVYGYIENDPREVSTNEELLHKLT